MVLWGANSHLQDDLGVVLAAVRSDGTALQCASAALRKERHIVAAAVRQNGEAIFWAADALRDDPEILRKDPDMFLAWFQRHLGGPAAFSDDLQEKAERLVAANRHPKD